MHRVIRVFVLLRKRIMLLGSTFPDNQISQEHLKLEVVVGVATAADLKSKTMALPLYTVPYTPHLL